jgi:hypothetical protein
MLLHPTRVSLQEPRRTERSPPLADQHLSQMVRIWPSFLHARHQDGRELNPPIAEKKKEKKKEKKGSKKIQGKNKINQQLR